MTAQNDTLLQLQSSVRDISQAVGRIEGQLGTFVRQMATQDDRTTKLDNRVGKVENRLYWFSGVGAVLGAIVTKYIPSLTPHP